MHLLLSRNRSMLTSYQTIARSLAYIFTLCSLFLAVYIVINTIPAAAPWVVVLKAPSLNDIAIALFQVLGGKYMSSGLLSLLFGLRGHHGAMGLNPLWC